MSAHMSAFGGKADIVFCAARVRFCPEAGCPPAERRLLLSPNLLSLQPVPIKIRH